MLQGHELTTPIQYGYLILAGILILMASISGILYIIRDIRANATTEPDYLGYWKKLHDLQKSPIRASQKKNCMVHEYTEDQNSSPILPTTTYVAKPNPYDKKKVDVFLQTQWPVARNSFGAPLDEDAVGYYTDDNDRPFNSPTLEYDTTPSERYRPIIGRLDWKYYDLAPFDWSSFLEALINGNVSAKQIDRAKVLSAFFQTCPAGQVHPDIPREEDGEPGQPKDEQLCRLGAEFWRALNLNEYTQARDIYHQIKAREKQLLNPPSFRFIRGLSGSEGSEAEG